jgi:hypothetical protein
VSGVGWEEEEEEEEEAIWSSPKQILHSTNTLEHYTTCLAMYGKWACIHELSNIQSKF